MSTEFWLMWIKELVKGVSGCRNNRQFFKDVCRKQKEKEKNIFREYRIVF